MNLTGWYPIVGLRAVGSNQFPVLGCQFSELAPRAEAGMGLEVMASLCEVSRRSLSKKPPRRIRVFRFPVGALPTGSRLWIILNVRNIG